MLQATRDSGPNGQEQEGAEERLLTGDPGVPDSKSRDDSVATERGGADHAVREVHHDEKHLGASEHPEGPFSLLHPALGRRTLGGGLG